MPYTKFFTTGVIEDNTGVLQVLHAAVRSDSAVDTTLITAVLNKRIRVVSMVLSTAVVTTPPAIRFKSNATVICERLYLTAKDSIVAGFNPLGWFETNVNEPLNFVTSNAGIINISIRYVLVESGAHLCSSDSGIFDRFYADDIIEDKTGGLTVKHLAVSRNPPLLNSKLINAVAGKALRIISFALASSNTTSPCGVKFINDTLGNDLTSFIYQPPAGTIFFDFQPYGWFETDPGLPLYCELQCAVSDIPIYISARYVEISY